MPTRIRSLAGWSANARMIDQSPLPDLPLHFTEWSSAYTPTDFMHDTYQQAAFILSKVKGAYQSVNSMSYWAFTDIFEENGPRMTPFHGGFGLINYEDLKKPAFYAFKFLNELGRSNWSMPDPASWVCQNPDDSVQALFWNYTPIVPPAGANDQQFYQHEIPPGKRPGPALHHQPARRQLYAGDLPDRLPRQRCLHRLSRSRITVAIDAGPGRDSARAEQRVSANCGDHPD